MSGHRGNQHSLEGARQPLSIVVKSETSQKSAGELKKRKVQPSPLTVDSENTPSLLISDRRRVDCITC